MINRFTRWPEAVPLAEITAEAVVNGFFASWVAHFGAPIIIT